MDLGSIKTDAVVVEAGRWIDNIPGMDDLRLKVRGTDSFVYRDTLARLTRAVPRGEFTEDGRLPAAVNDRVTGEALAEVALLDWENATLGKVVLPYSKDQAKQMLTDPNFGRFYDAVLWAANKVNQTSAEAEAALSGNSAGG